MIMNLDVDMTGFREAVLITGTNKACPLIKDCTIRWVHMMLIAQALPDSFVTWSSVIKQAIKSM